LCPSNDIAELEEEIECIRVTHPDIPRASLPGFIDSVDEVVENSAEEEEQCMLDTYGPALSMSLILMREIQDVPIVPYRVAREGVEVLRLFRIQNSHLNSQKGEHPEGRVCCTERGKLRVYKAFYYLSKSSGNNRRPA